MKSHRSQYGMPFERVAFFTLLASATAVFLAAGSGVQISMVDRTPSARQVAFIDRGSAPVVIEPEVVMLSRVLPDPRTRATAPSDSPEVIAAALSPRLERLTAVVDRGTGALLAAALSGGGLLTERTNTQRGDDSIVKGVAVPVAFSPSRSVDAWAPPLASVRDIKSMTRRFEQIGYRLEGVRDGDDVPRLFLASLPQDLPAVDSVDERKRLFIKALLPHILRVNETILEERNRLQRLAQRHADGLGISSGDQTWLAELALRYGESPDDFGALLRRHDIVPPSLALAQSIEESGWGTSRFALHGNALFGQRTFEPGDGMVPKQRGAGEQHEVKSFDHLHESVLTYVLNLNRHTAYKEFRRLREVMRGKEAPLNGSVLAGSMTRYSERGQEYVDTIRTIMRTNDLAAFDGAKLQDPHPLRVARGF